MNWLLVIGGVVVAVLVVIGIYLLVGSHKFPSFSEISNFLLFEDKDWIHIYPATNLTIYKPLGTKSSPFFDWYNPSIVLTDDGFLALIRESNTHGRKDVSNNPPPWFSRVLFCKIGFDGTISNMRLIDFDYDSFDGCKGKNGVMANGVEDARLFRYDGSLWGIANILGAETQHDPCVNAVVIFNLSQDLAQIKPVTVMEIPKQVRQKNWAPFEYTPTDGGRPRLLCEYSINPHQIIDCTDFQNQDNQCKKIYSTTFEPANKYEKLSGGSCPILLTLLGESLYVNVCHNYRTIGLSKHYYSFIYTFRNAPPFDLTHISKPFKIGRGEDIQFVSGMDYDPSTNELILSYGIDDSGIHIGRFPIDNLLSQTSSQ